MNDPDKHGRLIAGNVNRSDERLTKQILRRRSKSKHVRLTACDVKLTAERLAKQIVRRRSKSEKEGMAGENRSDERLTKTDCKTPRSKSKNEIMERMFFLLILWRRQGGYCCIVAKGNNKAGEVRWAFDTITAYPWSASIKEKRINSTQLN